MKKYCFIGILQPSYLPWLGYFEQIDKTDIFVFLDDVQFDRGGWRNRNKIKGCNGVQWLTVPVHFKLSDKTLIKDVKIDNHSNWSIKHLRSIIHNYNKAKFFKLYEQELYDIFEKKWVFLLDLNIYIIEKFVDLLGIKGKKFYLSSEITKRSSDKIERLIEICNYFSANIFYEGSAGRNYIDCRKFKERGIDVVFQDYHHPVYEQLYGGFISYLSVVDLLLNCGIESLNIIRTGSKSFLGD